MKRETLTDSVFKQLQSAILNGELEPGATLPSERAYAEQMGINRGAIREALKKLENARLIKTHQGGNTRVLDFRETGGLDLIGELILDPSGGLNREVILSLIELRVVVQPDMARLAVLRGGEDLLPSLRNMLDKMREPGATDEEVNRLTEDFWDELGRHSGNICYRLILNTMRSIRESRAVSEGGGVNWAYRDFSHFERIVDAVEHKDADAARVAAKERSDLMGAAVSKVVSSRPV